MASKKISGITIEIGGETTKLTKSLADVNKESRDLSKELRGVETLLKFDPTNVTLLAQKQAILTESIDSTKKKLDQLKEAQVQVQAQFDKGEITEQQYRDFQREIVSTEQKLNKLETQADEFGKTGTGATKDVTDGAEEMGDGFDKALKKLDGALLMGIADTLSNVAGKMIDFGKATFDAFNKVDEGLDIIVTKTGASAEAMEGFEQVFRTIVGRLPVEDMSKVGEAIGEVNTQFGFYGDELEKASEQAVMFSEINGQDVTSSVIGAKQAISAYGLEFDEFGDVLDITTKVAQDTGVSVGELNKKVIDGAPQLKQLGLGFYESTVLMGQFEKAGVDSNAMLMALNKASITYAKDGKTLQEGLNGTVEAIKRSTDETEKLRLAQEVFGIRGANKMVDAINRGEFALDDLFVAMEDVAGQTERTFTDTLDPIDSMTVAQNNLTLAMSDMGDAIATTLAPIFEVLAEAVQNFATWFGNLNPVIKDAIVIFGGIVTVLGLLSPVIIAITVAVTSLEVAILPIIGVIAGVVVGITALILIFKNWGAITDWFSEKWTQFTAWISQLWENLKTFAINVWNAMGEGMKNLVKGAIDFVVGYYTFLWETAKSIFNFIKDFIVGIFTGLKSIMSNLVQGAVDGIVGIWNGLKSIVSGIFNGVVDTIKSILNIDLTQIGKDIIGGLANGIKGAVGAVADAVGNIGNSIVSGFKGFFGIHSPSRLMRDKIGKMLPQGIGVGIEADTDEALKAVDDMNKQIMEAGQQADYTDLFNGVDPKLPKKPEPDSQNGQGGEGFVDRSIRKLEEAVDSLKNVNMVLDDGTIVGKLSPKIDQELGETAELRERGM